MVLISVDQSCPLVISSIHDPECGSTDEVTSASEIPLVVIIGGSGVGLLLVVLAVVISLVIFLACKSRTTMVVTRANSQRYSRAFFYW